jgi:uncharacterized protein YeaO (DUF488 family)
MEYGGVRMNPHIADIAQRERYLAVFADKNVRYVCPHEISLDMKDSPCRIKDHDDGVLSMTVFLRLTTEESQVLSIPLTYWKTTHLPSRLPIRGKEEDVHVLEESGLARWISQQFHDVFALYALEDLRGYSADDVLGIINLSPAGEHCGIQISRVMNPGFQAVSLIRETAHRQAVAEERMRQDLVLLRAREKLRLSIEQQKMEHALHMDRLVLDDKIKRLEHARNLESHELEAARHDIALRVKQLELVEVQLSKTGQEILQIQEETRHEQEFERSLDACKESLDASRNAQQRFIQELDQTFVQFSGLFTGIASTAEQLKSSVDTLSSFPSVLMQSTQQLDDILKRLDTVSELSRKQEPTEKVFKTFAELFKHELDNRDKGMKAMLMEFMKQLNPSLERPLQAASTKIDLLASVRQSMGSALLEGKSSVGIIISFKGRVIRPIKTPALVRKVTIVPDPIAIGSKYKLLLDIPQDGYLWIFHFGRKRDERPHLLYPFVSKPFGPVVGPDCFHRGDSVVFPDDVLHDRYSLNELESTGPDAMDKDAYVAFLFSQPVPLVSSEQGLHTLEVDVAKGPKEDFCGIGYLDTSLLKEGHGDTFTCGMVEYRVD